MRSRSNFVGVLGGVGGAVLLTVASAAAQGTADAVTAALVERLDVVSGHVLTAAEDVPEDGYSHQPTEEVRSLGELFDHVASAQFAYCAAIGGESMPASAREPATAKAEIVEKVRVSRDFCLSVYRSATGDAVGETISLFGDEQTRAFALIQNVAHSNLHYGNIITYMRELGLVPPSSE